VLQAVLRQPGVEDQPRLLEQADVFPVERCPKDEQFHDAMMLGAAAVLTVDVAVVAQGDLGQLGVLFRGPPSHPSVNRKVGAVGGRMTTDNAGVGFGYPRVSYHCSTWMMSPGSSVR